MKTVFFIVLISLVITGCSCHKKTHNDSNRIIEIATSKESTYKLYDNKGLIKNNSSYEIVDKKGFRVIEFRLVRNPELSPIDGHYYETIRFEFPVDKPHISLRDQELLTSLLHINFQCFCKGKAGDHAIQSGSLQLQQNQQEVSFILTTSDENFSIESNRIQYSFQL